MTETPPATFADLVKTHFDYLLAGHGFTVAATRDVPQRQYWEVLLESAHCYIKFSLSRQDWEMQMAARTGPPGQAAWLPAGLVYNYVTRAPVNVEESLEPRPVLSPGESLKQWAETFRPASAQAIAFFNPDGLAERLQDYRNFVAGQNAEARRQLEAWQAKHNTQA
jgi:hypothetical protein